MLRESAVASETQPVVVEQRGAVALLTINRPEALNALDAATLEALGEAVEQVSGSGARALVLTGEGRAFAAGALVRQLPG